MRINKKAMLVRVNLLVRIIIDDRVDPDVDKEFDETVAAVIKNRLSEEGVSLISEGIFDYEDDLENPFDPEYDS